MASLCPLGEKLSDFVTIPRSTVTAQRDGYRRLATYRDDSVTKLFVTCDLLVGPLLRSPTTMRSFATLPATGAREGGSNELDSDFPE